MKDLAAISQERAMTLLLISDESRMLAMRSKFDRAMFLEPLNFVFVSEAARLHGAKAYNETVLCAAVEALGETNATKHFNMLLAAMTPTMVFESLYLAWLDKARVRFLRASEREIDESMDASSIVKVRQDNLRRYTRISGGRTGVSLTDAVQLAKAQMRMTRDVDGKRFVYTGFDRVDDALLALMPRTMTVLGARPGIGKTSIAMQIAVRASSMGTILFNSLEMSPEALSIKVAGHVHGVNTRRFMATHKLGASEYAESIDYINSISDIPIVFTNIVDFQELEAVIAEVKPVLTIYDYLQKPPTPAQYRGNRVEFLDDQAQEAADLAVRSDHPLLVLSQIGRTGEKGAKSSNLKGSGGIEEAADNVLLLERCSDDPESLEWFKLMLTVGKSRFGFDGVVQEVFFNRLTQSFGKWDEGEAARIWRQLNPTTVP